jgi:hypothetical protein
MTYPNQKAAIAFSPARHATSGIRITNANRTTEEK